MTRNELRNVLTSTKGAIFTVTFTKKDGSTRVMNCRTGVTKHLKGGDSTIAGHDHLLSVYDMQSKGYRCVNLDTVTEAVVNGKRLTVRPEAV